MRRPRFIFWLAVALTLSLATAGFWFLLSQQGAAALANVVYVIGGLLTAGWTVAGLVWWSHVGWVAQVSRLVVLTLGLGLLAGLSLSLGARSPAIMAAGVWGMAVLFTLGLALLRLAFSPGWSTLGVARTLVDEAIRMKMALIFVIMLLLLVPVLPYILGGETRLQYRLESFLTYALTVVSALLSIMTILLAVRTVSSELDEKQAFLTLTKPVSRSGYLAGKWLGIMGLNLLLLAVSGVGVYAFVQVLREQPAMDLADAAAVQEQVLTARASAQPVPLDPVVMAQRYEEKVRELRQRGVDPEINGRVGDPLTVVEPAQQERLQFDVIREWLSVPPRNRVTYRFAGLADARDAGPTVQLRFQPDASIAAPGYMVHLQLRVNDRDYIDPRSGQPLPPIRNDTFHTAYVMSDQIREDGTLDLTVIHDGADLGQSTVVFDPADGLEIFYRVGSFGGNLAKALTVLWIRLGFLAALGLAAATFLSFPVACLFCFLVFFAAVGSEFLSESLSNYASIPRDEVPWWSKITLTIGKFVGLIAEGEVYDAFKLAIRLVGETFTFLVPPLARYSPTPDLAYGRALTLGFLREVLLRIGLVSTGVVALAAIIIFRRREIARVTV